jgi:hypothetical protein
MQRSVDWFVLLEDRERPGRGLGRSLDQHFDLAASQVLAVTGPSPYAGTSASMVIL